MPSESEVLSQRRLNERERQRLAKAKYREENRDEYNAKMREWNKANRERLNREKRERLKNDPAYAEKVRSQGRKRNAENPERVRNTNLKTIYGMTLDDYKKMYARQEGKCAICGEVKPDHGSTGLAVDHCHTAGHVRELLCPSCNHGLGKFKDDIVRLQKAIAYLEKHGKEI